MAHVVKCTICGERFDRDLENFVFMSNNTRYAHAHCALDKWEKSGANPNTKPVVCDPNNTKKCMYCKKPINLLEDEYVQPFENLYAHKECQDKEEQRPKSDREQLEMYIANLYGEDFCPPRLQQQIIKFETERGLTYSGMLKSLIYFYDIKNNPIPEYQSVGIIPYIYDEAKEYYKKLYYASLYNSQRDIKSYIPKEQKISITQPHREAVHRRNLFTFLDEEGEDNS